MIALSLSAVAVSAVKALTDSIAAVTALDETTMEVDAAAVSEAKVDKNEVETEAEADDDLGFAGSDLFKVMYYICHRMITFPLKMVNL